MSESTVKLRAVAEVAAIKEMTSALVAYTAAVRAAKQAAGESGGGGGPGAPGPGVAPGPGGGASALPSSSTPPAAPGVPGFPVRPAAPGVGVSPGPGGGASALPSGPPPPPPLPPPVPQHHDTGLERMDRAGGSYLMQAGAMATGLGLGASVFGFFLNSGQKYLELSKIISVVSARFREAEENALRFGGAMGYTISESAGLVETLGSAQDRFSRGEVTRYTGFARTMGLDPNTALRSLGSMAATRGGEALTDRELAELAGRALAAGMGQGRFGEYLSGISDLGQAGFNATGAFSLQNTLTAASLPGLAFGTGDPRAQGAAGRSMVEGIHGMLTGSPAMQTFLMRAMGFGSEGGPSYIEMRKRLEAGVHDPENLRDLFSAFQARGLGKGAMYRALESVSGGQLKAWQLEGMVDALGSPEGLRAYEREAAGGNARSYMNRFTGGEEADFVRSGRSRISMGEARAVQMEGMQMAVGDTVAKVMVDMTTVLQNLAKTGQNLLQLDFEKMFSDLSGALVMLSQRLEESSRTGSDAMRVVTTPARSLSDDNAVMLEEYLRTKTVQGAALSLLYDDYGTAGGTGP